MYIHSFRKRDCVLACQTEYIDLDARLKQNISDAKFIFWQRNAKWLLLPQKIKQKSRKKTVGAEFSKTRTKTVHVTQTLKWKMTAGVTDSFCDRKVTFSGISSIFSRHEHFSSKWLQLCWVFQLEFRFETEVKYINVSKMKQVWHETVLRILEAKCGELLRLKPKNSTLLVTETN